jgi:GNAT superfamily N-acetyltransferase
MTAPPRVVYVPDAPDTVRQFVRDRLDMYDVAATGRTDGWPVTSLLRDDHEEVAGGLLATIRAGWMHLQVLWVAEPCRGRGHGRALLGAAETLARERGCRHVHLESFSFQAPDFYRRLGDEPFAVLDDFPPGHAHHFLRKRL